MQTLNTSPVSPERGIRANEASPVVVATDGRAQSDAALTMGRLFAESRGALRVVTVVKTMPVVSEAQLAGYADVEAVRQSQARRDVRDQMTRLWGGDEEADEGAEYEVDLGEGDPATVVARLAHDASATLIVCGLGRHRIVDRMFGDETALGLVRVADVPVFAAVQSAAEAPGRIVVAIDFSETSLRAARMALDLAAPGATIYLAYVAPRDASLYEWQGGERTFGGDAGAALQKTRDQLHVPGGCRVQAVLLKGDPATELLAFASSVGAELIATGSHGRGFVTRMLVGSVATKLIRCATCSVLTVPHAAAMTRFRITTELPSVVALPHADWTAALDEFSRRNVGRRGVLEVDDPSIGAQAQVLDYPLLGATFDGHDQCAELMLGELGDVSCHLTREIGGVTAIDILRGESGRDIALRIAHGTGQTLLTFTS
jgi:nucleotide-binding universal stress UspA family protein